MRNLKRQLRSCLGLPLQSLGYATGLMQLTASFRRIDGAIILMYHSVAEETQTQWIDPRNHVPVDVFEQQVIFLAQRRRVVRLAELIAMLREGKTPKTGTIVITFDDGYLDNLTVAAPILDRHGLTATLFLPIGYIDRGETQWIDQTYTAFKFRTKRELMWGENETTVFDLDDPIQYAAGYRAVCMSLLSAIAAQRHAWLYELHDQLQPSERPPRLTMTWDDVQTLLTNHQCFQIDGHTMEHTDMTSVSDDIARHELTGCVRRMEDIMDIQPRNFSFPYGRTSQHLRQLVAQAGLESACGDDGSDPIINSATDLYSLPRIEAPASMRRFDLLTKSANTGIWRRLGQ